jgi:hypothetical protein
LPARNAEGVVLGQEVLKLDQNGKVLMMLGKMGVGASGTDTFDRPTGVAIAANGDIFVSDGHGGNASNNGRVVKFSKDGRFIKTWGHKGSATQRSKTQGWANCAPLCAPGTVGEWPVARTPRARPSYTHR